MRFRAQIFGWEDALRGKSDACLISPRFVEGALEEAYVEPLDYWQQRIGGNTIDPATLERIGESTELPPWDDRQQLYWPNESSRTRAFRALQSWYREEVLKSAPGSHPIAGQSELPVGSELDEMAGRAGLNFLHSEIAAYAWDRARILQSDRSTLGFKRLERGMLSSMPLCFNLFGYLRSFRWIAAHVLSELLQIEMDQVTRIEVEMSPQPVHDYLNDKTAFDAFIEYTTGDKRGFIAVETKYTDTFGDKPLEKVERYTPYCTPDHGWNQGAFERLSTSKARQLLRNVLLACAVKTKGFEGSSPFDEMHAVVATARHDAEASVVVDLLSEERADRGATIHHVTFEEITERCMRFTETECWAREFRRRYLDLSPVLRSDRFLDLKLSAELRTQAALVVTNVEVAQAEQEMATTQATADVIDPPYPGQRGVPTWVYCAALAAGGLLAAYINQAALLVFGLSNVWTVIAAIAYAGVFATGAHAVGIGVTTKSRDGAIKLIAGLAALLGLLVGSLAMVSLRASYLETVGREGHPWAMLGLTLIIEIVACAVAVLHANPTADALYRSQRRVHRSYADRQDLIEQHETVRHQKDVEEQFIQGVAERDVTVARALAAKGSMVLGAFLAGLGQHRGLADLETEAIVQCGSLPLPARLLDWEAWLSDRAPRLDRPPHRRGLPGSAPGYL